jgi:gamma-butyrobetaine dioxygenase
MTDMTANSDSAPEVSFDQVKRRLRLDWDPGEHIQIPFIWLRHARFFPLMGRPEQLDPRAHLLPEEPSELQIETARVSAGELIVEWGRGRGETRHQLAALRDFNSASTEEHLSCHQPITWLAQDARDFQRFDAADIEDPVRRLDLFVQLRDYGIALVSGLPAEPGTLETVAKYFGPVRRTHFGELFDIRSRPEDQDGSGQNIGATAANSQAPHTDETWRHGPPGINLFHCLLAHPGGEGASIFVDGIGAAQALEQQDPESFKLLASIPLSFTAERNSQERFSARSTVIAIDSNDQIRGIRITDRTLPPLDLPIDLIEPAYRALSEFYRLLLSPQRCFECRLKPGELVVFDNHRVLHGRRAFDPLAGERWLQQLSVDREEFQNRLRQLAEAQGRSDIARWQQDGGALSAPRGKL